MKNAAWWVMGSRFLVAFTCMFLMGCFLIACQSEGERDSETLMQSGVEQLLEPGGYIVGMDGFRVSAPEGALEEAVWLTIERVERPVASELPEELEQVGETYRVTGREPMRFEHVPLLFELPRYDATDAAELAATFLIPGAWLDHSIDGEDVWEPIDGRLSEDEQRFVVDVWSLMDGGHTVTLAHGEYFTHWSSDGIEQERTGELEVRDASS